MRHANQTCWSLLYRWGRTAASDCIHILLEVYAVLWHVALLRHAVSCYAVPCCMEHGMCCSMLYGAVLLYALLQ